MKEKKWRIELTEHQLMLMAQCVEDCHRFAAGQTELDYTTSCLDNRKDIRHMLDGLKNMTGEYDWCGNGCTNKDQKIFIQETYYLYREIVHQVTIEKAKYRDMHPNVYLDVTLTCEGSGEPIKVERIE